MGVQAWERLGVALQAPLPERECSNEAGQLAYAMQRVQLCQNVIETKQVVSGYTVVYRYAGRGVKVTLPYDPGNAVTISVSVLVGR
jgi:uncharacterized protein YcfJ